jgi:3-methyladenine DNA glycosylase/8-oxoguanine DNA glycosylase
MNINIPTPEGFDLKRTTGSHGWSELRPFEYVDAQTLVRVLDVGEAAPVTVTITGGARGLDVRASRRLNRREAARVVRDVRHMMRLDDDMTHFYAAVSRHPEFAWIARDGAGRLLRSPTVFEDLVKSICTTNCTWALTKLMTANLVQSLGREGRDGRRAFPAPEAMAARPVEFYRETVRAGYRSEYLKELAERVASGELDPESWFGSELPTEQLKRAMKKVKGVGDYAAENLLKLVGRYDVLALDSWVRAQFARKRNQGRACDDKKIARFYARFDSWRGLALWCDMTEEWFEKQS